MTVTRPLHSFGAHKYACATPERPYARDVQFDFRCYACWLAAKAAVLNGHGDEIRWSCNSKMECRFLSLAVLVEETAGIHTRASA